MFAWSESSRENHVEQGRNGVATTISKKRSCAITTLEKTNIFIDLKWSVVHFNSLPVELAREARSAEFIYVTNNKVES